MRSLRHPLFQRPVAWAFIFVTLFNLIPESAIALTIGPHQPEYTSYEEAGATDMVNLLTGDFSYNLPIISVPSPEGEFTLPLTYNAGIGLEQEASWVGLGWNVNAGSLTRVINEFPDDANGEGHSVTMKDLIGLKGWEANLPVGKFGWNNQVGHFGHLSLLSVVNATWYDGYTSVGIAGVNITSEGLRFSLQEMTMAAISLATILACSNMSAELKEFTKVASNAMTGASIMAQASKGLPRGPGVGSWTYQRSGFNIGVFRKFRVWLDKTRYENMYGALYLGNQPTNPFADVSQNASLSYVQNGTTTQLQTYSVDTSLGSINRGSASDVNFVPDVNEEMKEYYDLNNPAMVAADQFSIKAPQISGSISPYRLEVGSVAMPRDMSSSHQKFALLKYLNDYKVPFVYDGQMTNSYFYHVGGATAVNSPSWYFGLSGTAGARSLTYGINDVTSTTRVRSDLNSTKRIAQANNIEWLTNGEIKASTTYPSGFLDFLNGSARTSFRSQIPGGFFLTYSSTQNLSSTLSATTSGMGVGDLVDLTLTFYASAQDQVNAIPSGVTVITGIPVQSVGGSSFTVSSSQLAQHFGKVADVVIRVQKQSASVVQKDHSIGGFCVTSASGTTYHFALPIYESDMFTRIQEIANPDTRLSIIQRDGAYPNTWLLTSITGPDFVDRNGNGAVDEADWGTWVKFNYGRHLPDYGWRFPWTGFKKDPSGIRESFTSGKCQLVYLNSIETRSHVALFLKSQRVDGRSTSNAAYNPLRLDEMALVTRSQYKQLVTAIGQGGGGMTELTNQIDYVLKGSDLTATAADLIKKNCIKRVQFVYDYTLCQGTPNSTSGKLTLNRLSVLGKNNVKATPDYIFRYGSNPAYNQDYWDAWGFYSSQGTSSPSSHAPSSITSDASAWSLSKIITPLGAEVRVNYERDEYASVAGDPVISPNVVSFDVSGLRKYYPTGLPLKRVYVSYAGNFSVGDQVRVLGSANYTCGTNPTPLTADFNSIYTISSVGSEQVEINGVQVQRDYVDVNADYLNIGTCSLVNSGDYVQFSTFTGTVSKVLLFAAGGDLRVGSITTLDYHGPATKIRYLYSKDGMTSGVIGDIPDYMGFGPRNIPGIPQTPVIYGQVTILNGQLSSDTDFHTKAVHEFYTPDKSLYSLNKIQYAKNQLVSSYLAPDGYTYYDYLNIFENRVSDFTSKVGKPKSVKIYDASGVLKSSTDMFYADQSADFFKNDGVNNFQGVYSSGTILVDRVSKDQITKIHKLNRTTVLRYPFALTKVVNTHDGYTTTTQNLNWDFISGEVVEKLERSQMGAYTKSVIVPAYKIASYSTMGPKSTSASNKHMLTQVAGTYTYASDAAGTNGGLLNATINTWKNQWPYYRTLSLGNYIDVAESTDSEKIWRIEKSYSFQGNYGRLKNDGTLAFNLTTDDFWVNPASPTWLLTGQSQRFDRFGMILESYNPITKRFSATKMGYGDRIAIIQGEGSAFKELAFTGCEDYDATTGYFGGEVKLGAGGSVLSVSKAQTAEAHTGDVVVSSSGAALTFISDGIIANRTYRAFVWTNNVNGRIYWKLNQTGTEQLSPAPTGADKVGNWYRIAVDIPTTTGITSIEVGAKSASGVVLFDDFRFQPKDASTVASVIMPDDFRLTGPNYHTFSWSLDSENFFTKTEFDEVGTEVKVYAESLKYGVKLISETKRDFRRFHVNQ